jgi:hypothetical protein
MNKLNKFFLVILILNFTFPPQSFSEIIIVDQKIRSTAAADYDFVTRKTGRHALPVFKTIQSAIDNAMKGDTIIIREGFYREQLVINQSGVTLMNFNHEKVIIDGNNPRFGPLINIQSSDIKLIGLTVMHSSSYGIYSIGNDNVIVRNCEVAYSEDGGIVFVNGENVLIEHCRVHHNNYKGLQAGHEGITLRGVKHFEVRYCEVYDNKEEGIDAKYGALYGRIHNNRLYRNNGPQIYVDVANHIEIFNNIIYDAISKSGISLNIESTWKPKELEWTLHNIKVYNNLIYNNHGGIGFWLEPGGGSEENAHWDSISIVNNTLVNNSQPGSPRGGGIYIANGEPHNFGNNILIKNNIIWEKTNEVSKCIRDTPGEIVKKFKITHNVFPEGEPTDAKGESPLIVSDINFADAYNHDYRLTKNSPAIEAGHPEEAPLFDLDMQIRKAESRPDIGAYKWVKSLPDIN